MEGVMLGSPGGFWCLPLAHEMKEQPEEVKEQPFGGLLLGLCLSPWGSFPTTSPVCCR